MVAPQDGRPPSPTSYPWRGSALLSVVTILPALIWSVWFDHIDFWILMVGSVAWGLSWGLFFKIAISRGHFRDLRDFFTALKR